MKTRNRALKLADIPTDYAGLFRMHPIRPIHDKVDLDNATRVIDAMAGHELNNDQEDYLEAIATLVVAYEDEHKPVKNARVSPMNILRHLVEQSEMTASQLGDLLGNRSLGSKLLRGERDLSKSHIRTLADYFKVSTDLFF